MTHLLLATIGKNAQACHERAITNTSPNLASTLGERCKHSIIRLHESAQRSPSALAFPLLNALTGQTRKHHLPGLQRVTVLALPAAMLSQRKEQNIVERKTDMSHCHTTPSGKNSFTVIASLRHIWSGRTLSRAYMYSCTLVST